MRMMENYFAMLVAGCNFTVVVVKSKTRTEKVTGKKLLKSALPILYKT